MKKVYAYLMILCLSLTAFTMTSCEDDNDDAIAYTLDGIWQGSLGQTYYYDNYYGYGYDYEEMDTEFRFYNSAGSTSGTGVEIDYVQGYWTTYYKVYEFKWNVAYNNIYLYFANGEELVIRDFSLSSNYLSGILETSDRYRVASLRLRKTNDWYWDSYYAKDNKSSFEETRASSSDSTLHAGDKHYGQKRKFNN